MFGHSSWDTSRIGFSAEVRKAPKLSQEKRVFTATTGGVGIQTRSKPGSDVNCEVSAWGEWALAGDGCQKVRTRQITREPKCDGRECPHLEETESVAAKDSVWIWGDWHTDPNDPCKEIRLREVFSIASCGGRVDDELTSGESSSE